jgi:hypothetical protein
VLLKYSLFDYKIRLKEGIEPTFRLIYQLSLIEIKTLREYINKNLKKGYIRKLLLLAGYLIIFVPKKRNEL